MAAYVALLRGINVGGHKRVSMERLRNAVASLGYGNVRTLLASGNVLFDARARGRAAMASRIERQLEKTLGHEIGVLVRTRAELAALARLEPFRGLRVTPRTRLFVTFLPDHPAGKLRIPYASPDGSFRILRRSAGALCSVLTLGPQWSKNLRQMDVLEKAFGRRITTRSWSTVLRIVKATA